VFRDIDRLAGSLLGAISEQRPARHVGASLDARRRVPPRRRVRGQVRLAGVDPASIEVTIEKNVILVSAERNWAPDQESQVVLLSERPQGRLSRQLLLGEDLETGQRDRPLRLRRAHGDSTCGGVRQAAQDPSHLELRRAHGDQFERHRGLAQPGAIVKCCGRTMAVRLRRARSLCSRFRSRSSSSLAICRR
jgi:hypothetical protein